MEWFESLALLLGSILVLMAIGMPVALAFLAANIVGAWFFMGGAKGVTLLLNNGFGGLTNYALAQTGVEEDFADPVILADGRNLLLHRFGQAHVQCH